MVGQFGFAGFDIDITKRFTRMGKAIIGIANSFVKSTPKLEAFGKNLKGVNAQIKKSKPFKKIAKIQDNFLTGINIFAELSSVGLSMFGVFAQMADSMGILKPIMDLVSMIFQIIGASAMEKMIPAMDDMFAVLFSPEMMKFWGQLGEIIGDFMVFLMGMITQMFSDPNVRTMIMLFLKIFLGFLQMFVGILVTFFKILAMIPLPVLVAILIAVAGIVGFFWGLAHGGPIMGAIMGVAAAVAMGVIGAMALSQMAEGGIVTRPTIALIGEAGPEAVIPLDRGTTMDTDEIVWAMENNTARLDKLIYITEKKNKIKRLK